MGLYNVISSDLLINILILMNFVLILLFVIYFVIVYYVIVLRCRFIIIDMYNL